MKVWEPLGALCGSVLERGALCRGIRAAGALRPATLCNTLQQCGFFKECCTRLLLSVGIDDFCNTCNTLFPTLYAYIFVFIFCVSSRPFTTTIIFNFLYAR